MRCRARRGYREFIQDSRAEFGVAKHTYVATRSGWFSDRTECYLASAGRRSCRTPAGRAPAVRRGPARVLDHGEALAGIERINADYPGMRGEPRDRASHFDARVVLPPLARDRVTDAR
jgi:hypothetical protein